MRVIAGILLLVLAAGTSPALAEVTGVSITSRRVVADGQPFGAAGPYERIVGRIHFALDPAHPRNKAIVDLDLAPRGPDKRVQFSADLYVLQPVDPARGNGAMLFEVANRGRKGILGMFNRARASNDPMAAEDFGDGYLLREGYTLVWVGWQFDVAAPLLTINAPRADLQRKPDTVRVAFVPNDAGAEITPAELPAYAPVDPDDPTATLTVRDKYWDTPTPIARELWRFVPSSGRPRIRLERAPAPSGSQGGTGSAGFEPGRVYELSYKSLDAQVAGVGLAAIRDAASAFLYRDDLPVRGRSAYAFGISQSGRFLRQFLAQGFNVDERDRRVFDAVWPHIAGAAFGSFNERFAMPGHMLFSATQFPFTDAAHPGPGTMRGGVLASYQPAQQPKVIYTNTPVEYWGLGRAAALTHTTADGTSDLTLPDNVRIYVLAGSQHGESAIPPTRGASQQLGNPIPQRNVMRALLRAMHEWASRGTLPPASRYPKLADRTLVKASEMKFPSLPGVADPRKIEGPALIDGSQVHPLPFLVPQVDEDGNEVAGIRVPEVAVPLATTTGWNFRSPGSGAPDAIVALAGSYIPFPKTRAERQASRDPRRSIEERHRDGADYLRKIRTAAAALVKERYLLAEDVDDVVERAGRYWELAAGPAK